MADQSQHLLVLSARIVAAHAGHNQIKISSLTTIIRSVYNTLVELNSDFLHHPLPLTDAQGKNYRAGNDRRAHHDRHAHNVCVHPVHGGTVFRDHLVHGRRSAYEDAQASPPHRPWHHP